MADDTRHSGDFSGGLSGASIQTRTHKQVFVFTILSVTCQTTLAANNSALTHNVVPVNTAVPSCVGTCIVQNTLPLP